MELTAPLIFISIFVLASISLFLFYKFGIKKKSYEEALAEHRKQTTALLATKPKPKEKKSRKAAKRINKEKTSPINILENETPNDAESVGSKDTHEKIEKVKPFIQQLKIEPKSAVTSHRQSKIHVEFKEELEEVSDNVPIEKEAKDVTNKQKEDVYKPEPLQEGKKTEKSMKKNKHQKQETQQQQVERNSSPVDIMQPIEQEEPEEGKVFENIVAPLIQEAVVNTGKEKKKKKSEYNARQQITIQRDQLIYSVRNAELSRIEVQLLIDLLLNKQLEAPAVIDEWSEGKSDPIQKLKKQLAEKEKILAGEQEALAGVQAKLKEVRNEQLTEKAQLQQKVRAVEESKTEIVAAHNILQLKIQELEDHRNKELVNFQRVVEDNKTLQMQRGQLEAALMNYQETDSLLHNLKTDNTHLSTDIQKLTQELQEQATNYQNSVIQIQTLQEELRIRNEYVINVERNHNFAVTAQMEEKRGLTEELQRLTNSASKEKQRLIDIIQQLEADNQKLHDENNMQINGSSDENKAHEVKLLNLTNELSSVKSELSSVNKKLHDVESQYQTELKETNEKHSKLQSELEEQKNKNNELRQKNWKVIEALNAAESRNIPAASRVADVNIDLLTLEIKSKEQNAQKEFLQRLFPEIGSLKSVTTNDWQAEFGRLIKKHVSQLWQKKAVLPSPESTEITKLQTEICHYKKIIDETEAILRKLQSHIEQEERNWRLELTQKDAEIQELKNKCVSQLQVKVSSLENQLAQEQIEKQRLLDECLHLVNKPEVKAVQGDSMATIERLSEEVDYLKEQLRREQTKTSDANVFQNGNTS